MSASPLVVSLPRLGIDVPGIKSYSVSLSYTVPADAFRFSTFSSAFFVDLDSSAYGSATALELEQVDISLHGCYQLSGRVERSEVGGDGSAINYAGRDYIADLIECHVDPGVTIPDGITLRDALLLACGPCGITEVLGDSDALLRNARTGTSAGKPAPADFLAEGAEKLKPQDSEGVYAFASRLAARFGATLQPGVSRSQLVVAAPRYDGTTLYTLLRAKGGAGNNILDATAVRDYTHFPTAVLFSGRQADGTGAAASGVIGTKAEEIEAFDRTLLPYEGAAELIATGRRKPKDGPFSDGKLYRLWYRRDTTAKNKAQLDKAAKRAKAERTKAVLQYTATVRGHQSPSGAIWAPDTMVEVADDVAGVHAVLWIESVEHTGDTSGARTTISAILPGSYVF